MRKFALPLLSVSMLFVLAVACSTSEVADNLQLQDAGELLVTQTGTWVTLTDGFDYRLHETGIGFRVRPPDLTNESLAVVQQHIDAIASTATTDLEIGRLAQWEAQLAKARKALAVWEQHSDVVEAALAEANLSTSDIRLQSCNIAATAEPTTAEPGAKAYATGYCSPGSPVSGGVQSETSARAGNDWPTPCRDEGWTTTQCMSAAYGTTGCDSAATVEYYYEFSDLTFIVDQEYDWNGYCE